MSDNLLLGASGYLGARIYQDLHYESKLMPTHHGESMWPNSTQLDVTDPQQVMDVIQERRPAWIVHCANNGSGSWCEQNPEAAKKLNQTATQYIVDAANTVGAKVIYISSFAALDPVDVYGQTKKASEEILRKTHAGWVILRPRFILGLSPNSDNDRPFNRLLKNTLEQKPVSYDSSWQFQPTYIGHISDVIRAVIKQNLSEEVIPIEIDHVTSRYELALDLLTQFGVEVTESSAPTGRQTVATEPTIFERFQIPEMDYGQLLDQLTGEIKYWLQENEL